MTSAIIEPLSANSSDGNSGTNKIVQEKPDRSASWVFESLTEADPFRNELEGERLVMDLLRSGVSVFDLVTEAEGVTKEKDPWPNSPDDSQDESTPNKRPAA